MDDDMEDMMTWHGMDDDMEDMMAWNGIVEDEVEIIVALWHHSGEIWQIGENQEIDQV